MYCQSFDVLAIKPDVVVVNYIRPNNINMLLRYKKENIKIAVLDTEGSPGNDMEGFAKKVAQITDRNIISLYCLWGDEQYNAFKKENTFEKNILRITGCPRYDFCAEPYRTTLPKVLKGEKFILINTTFPVGNPKFTKSSQFEEQAMINMGYEEKFAQDYTKDSITACKKMIEVISDICMTFPQIKFILRPHPFESPEPYKKLQSCLNFEVHQEGSVIPWLNSCEALLHLNCQTAIEAVMVNKEPISIEWINTTNLKSQAPPEVVSHTPKNSSELKTLINKVVSRKTLSPNKSLIKSRNELIKSRLLSNDGNSSFRVSIAISELLEVKIEKEHIKCNIDLKQILREIFGYHLFHKARKIIQGNKSDFRRAEKSFSSPDVMNIIERLNNTNENKSLIKVSPIKITELDIPKLFSNQTIKITR